MYWIYIALFLFSVLVPRIAREEFFGLSLQGEEVAEMTLLFLAGLLGLILFNWRDVEARKCLEEKRLCARKASDAHRDLTSSYTYIGATNRKIDILKEIILTVPQDVYALQKGVPNERRSPYSPILEAMRLFSDCEDVLIGFYRIRPKPQVLFETVSNDEFSPHIPRELCFFQKHVGYVNKNGFAIIRTGRNIQGISAYAIIRRNHIKTQDMELMKALLVQAIFLYLSLDSQKFSKH